MPTNYPQDLQDLLTAVDTGFVITMKDQRKSRRALEFGRLLFDRRRQLKLTQQEVADRAGIHRTLLSDYERPDAPDRVPTDTTIYGLADALDVPVEQMFEWAGVRHPTVDVKVANHAPHELLDKLDRLEAMVQALTDRLESFGEPPPAKRPRRRPPAG